jgi:hypothetical protein
MQPLRSFFIFLILSTFITTQISAQPIVKNYEKEWKQVDAFIKKELPKSALEQVKKIYQQAKKEKQDVQVIKALVYMTGLQNEITENSEVAAISDIEKEMNRPNQFLPAYLRKCIGIIISSIAGSYMSEPILKILKKRI